MSRSHSRRSKVNAANARRWRREEAQRPRWSVWDTPLGWLVIILAFVPVLAYDTVSRIAERIRG